MICHSSQKPKKITQSKRRKDNFFCFDNQFRSKNRKSESALLSQWIFVFLGTELWHFVLFCFDDAGFVPFFHFIVQYSSNEQSRNFDPRSEVSFKCWNYWYTWILIKIGLFWSISVQYNKFQLKFSDIWNAEEWNSLSQIRQTDFLM